MRRLLTLLVLLVAASAQAQIQTTTTPTVNQGTAGLSAWKVDLSGGITINNASLAVTGTFWQATQPVSIATMPTTPVTGTFWQSTQPVSFTMPALVAGSAVIGHVIVDTGSTTAVTGNVAVTNASLDGTTLATIDSDIKANVTLHAGTNVIGHVIVDTAPSTAITNASLDGTTLATIASDITTTNANTAPLLVGAAGGYVRQDSTGTMAKETGGNLATVASNTGSIAKPSACGVTPYDSGSVDIPAFVPTVVTSTTTCVQSFTVTNPTRSPIQLQVRDGQTAFRLYYTDWIGPGEARTVSLNGIQMTSGMKWNGSIPGLSAQMRGYQ